MGRIRSEDTTLVSVRIPLELKRECEIKAQNDEISLNEWIRRAMKEKINGSGDAKDEKIRELTYQLRDASFQIEALKIKNEKYKELSVSPNKDLIERIQSIEDELEGLKAFMKAAE